MSESAEGRVALVTEAGPLRHTVGSFLLAIGKDPTYLMPQLGHTDPAFTLRVYARVSGRPAAASSITLFCERGQDHAADRGLHGAAYEPAADRQLRTGPLAHPCREHTSRGPTCWHQSWWLGL